MFTVLYIGEPGDRSRLDAYFDAVVFPDESSIRAAAHLGLYRKAMMVDAGSDGPEALEALWDLLRELESTGGPRSMVPGDVVYDHSDGRGYYAQAFEFHPIVDPETVLLLKRVVDDR